MSLLFESVALDIVVLIAASIAAIFLYITRNFNFWKKHGIPYEKPLPFVGNLKEAALQTLDIGQNLKKIYDKHRDKPYVGFFSFDLPALLLLDTELVKNVLVKDAHNFINRVQTMDENIDPLTANAIFALKGLKWKHVRVGMTPMFSTGKMKKMFCIVDQIGRELQKLLDKECASGAPVAVKDTMARFTTDVIASVAFGIDSNTLQNPDAEFRRYMRKNFTFNPLKSFATLAISFNPKLQKIFRLKILHDDVEEFLRTTIWTTVEYREKNGLDRKDFLDGMMALRKRGMEDDQAIKIDGDDFVAQSFAFLAGGFETSSTTMSFALYELSLQPSLQDELRRELMQHPLTYETLSEMKLLDRVVNETLRKYPIVPYLDRMTVKDYELPAISSKGTVTLKAGTGVYVPVYALHHDPEYYPEPHRFDPERFTEQNKQNRPHYAFLPFGEGPRNCLGMRFGMMQTKVGLAHVLSRYEVSPCEDTPIPVKINPQPFLMQSQGEIPLLFKKLS